MEVLTTRLQSLTENMHRLQTNQINNKEEVRSMFNSLKSIQDSPTNSISSAMLTNASGILGPYPRIEQVLNSSPFNSPIHHLQENPPLVFGHSQPLKIPENSSIFNFQQPQPRIPPSRIFGVGQCLSNILHSRLLKIVHIITNFL